MVKKKVLTEEDHVLENMYKHCVCFEQRLQTGFKKVTILICLCYRMLRHIICKPLLGW